MANDQARTIGRIIAKTWTDDTFKQRMLADPVATLNAEGMTVSPGVEVRVVENTASLFHLVLPLKPKPGVLSDEDLEHVAGGNCVCGCEGKICDTSSCR